MPFSRLLFLVGICLARGIMGDVLDPSNYAATDVIVTDVAIIGGGSAGTYAAINLRKMGQKVVLVEKKKHLGGHTNTYTDHSTKVTVDYGVQAFLNSSISLNYFAQLEVPVTNYLPPMLDFQEVDFSTGQPVIFNSSRGIVGGLLSWQNILGWILHGTSPSLSTQTFYCPSGSLSKNITYPTSHSFYTSVLRECQTLFNNRLST